MDDEIIAIMNMNYALKISSYRLKRLQIIRDHGYFSYKRLYKRLHREKKSREV